MFRKILFVIIALIVTSPIIAQSGMHKGKIFNDSISPGNNFNKAAFRLWYPEKLKTIKALVVLVPGSNGDGRRQVDNQIWQDFANRYGFALIGCYFTDYRSKNMAIEKYVNVKEGSGQALLEVLSKFGALTGHPELKDAPMLLWGHSAGGQFNYEFVCWKPERVVAFVVNKGGVYYSALAPEEARNVPGIFFTGENDMESRGDAVKGIFSINRRFGAIWTFAEEPGAGHELGKTLDLTESFFSEIIPIRIPDKPVNQYEQIKLNNILNHKAFIGDYKTKKYVPINDWQRTRYPTSWLPSKKFAEAWLSFVKVK